ncbi:MAG: DUF1778 domain-containing protein [Saprospiraceae bacterium]|nr:DUF1778 domain-containing protein [Saprospiraceae bacterium]
MLQAAIEKAEELIEKERKILATERDRAVFFEALNKGSKRPNSRS